MMSKSHCSCDKLTIKPPAGFWESLLLRVLPHFDIVKTVTTPNGTKVTVLYLRRFYIWRSSWIGLNFGEIYIHKIYRSDDDPDPHDHPWNFRTFVLKGSYTDEYWEFSKYRDGTGRRWRLESRDEKVSAPATRYRPRQHIHRVILKDGKPAWTLIVTGKYHFDADKNADWCFVTPTARVPWREYLGLTKGESHGG